MQYLIYPTQGKQQDLGGKHISYTFWNEYKDCVKGQRLYRLGVG